MKILFSFVACLLIALFLSCERPSASNSLLGNWEGRYDAGGENKVLLTVNESDLVFDHLNGTSSKHAYRLYKVSEGKDVIKIEGMTEGQYDVYFIDANTMRLGLVGADALKPEAPVISIVTFHRKR